MCVFCSNMTWWQGNVPKWPMNAVSMREAIGSAATASADGNAIPSISLPMESILKTCLHIHIYWSNYQYFAVTFLHKHKGHELIKHKGTLHLWRKLRQAGFSCSWVHYLSYHFRPWYFPLNLNNLPSFQFQVSFTVLSHQKRKKNMFYTDLHAGNSSFSLT